MEDQLISQLEGAARVILAPSNLVSAEQCHIAESVFLNFRKTKCPFNLCIRILETSTVDYVLFEAAGLLKTAIVQEWSSSSENNIISLNGYLLDYVVNRPNLAQYVRARIVQVIAIIIKIWSAHDSGEHRRKFLIGIEETLIMNDALHKQILGCIIISALMQEYANNVATSDVGWRLEEHLKEKKQFRNTDLNRIFEFSIRVLRELIEKDTREDTLVLLKYLLPIIEDVLHRDVWCCYMNEDIISADIRQIFCDDSDCKKMALNPDILDLFFTLYWKVRTNPQIAHHARNCLVHLASLNEKVFPTGDATVQYLSRYIQRFLKLISSIDIIDEEANGIADIVKKTVFTILRAVSLPENILNTYMEEIVRLTCFFIKKAAQEESMCANDCLYTGALETMFKTCLCIMSKCKEQGLNLCEDNMAQIFNVYLQCHLHGLEVKSQDTRNYNDEELDVEEDDKDKFKEQLQTIGHLGMQVPSYSTPLLAQVIEDRTSKLRNNLNKLVGRNESLNAAETKSMNALYDDLHWLVLIAGHVLCMDDDSHGSSRIPFKIMRHSMQQASEGQLNVDLTLQLLASAENVETDINAASDTIDHVIRLIVDVFRLCAIEKVAMSVHLEHILSPELSCTIVWFLRRWSASYLLLEENFYSEISVTFLQAFGEGSPGASWAINFLLDKVLQNNSAFKGEPAVIKETINLLIALVQSQSKAMCVINSPQVGHIIDLAIKGNYDDPQFMKRGLMNAIVLIGIAVCDTENEEEYWSQTLEPLQDKCKKIVSVLIMRQSCHREEDKIQIMDVLDRFLGAIQGVQHSTVEAVFQYMLPLLDQLPRLLEIYKNYQQIIELILELLNESAKLVLPYLLKNDERKLYEVCLHSTRTYENNKYHSKVCHLNADPTAEEDSFQDVLLLLELFTNLLPNRSFLIQEEVDTQREQNSFYPNLTAADVFYSGLTSAMNLTTMDLLKFPTLCLQFYKLISRGCELYAGKVCNSRAETLRDFLGLIELGLSSFGNEISELCCDTIQYLAEHIYQTSTEENERNRVMVPFLNILLNLTLSKQIGSKDVSTEDLFAPPSVPLYYLICCYPESYRNVVQNIISEQEDRNVQERLVDAFTKLMANVQFNAEAGQSAKFKNNLEIFALSVQVFLNIK